MRRKVLWLGTILALALFAALAATTGLTVAQGPVGQREAAPAAAAAAESNVSGSPYLQLPPELRNLPEAKPPAKRAKASEAGSSDVVSYNPSTKATSRAKAPERASGDAATPPFAGLLPEGVRAETVLGTDDRTRVTPTTSYPWRTIGYLAITAADNTKWMCSGALIGRDDNNSFHVLTAGHCIYMSDHGGWVQSVRFFPGLDGTFMPYNFANSKGLTTWNGWISYDDYRYDMGIVTLDRRIGNQTGWMGRRTASYTDAIYRGVLNTSGYPGDKPSGTQWFNANNGLTADDYNFWYYMDTYGGQSGSPVWLYDGTSRWILGDHAYGGTSSNMGIRFNSSKFESVRSVINGDPLPVDKPDFVDDGQSYATFSPTNAVRGQTALTVNNRVRNIGTATSPSYCVSYYASTDTTITAGDYLIGTKCGNPGIGPFQASDVNWNGLLPSSVPAGNYYVGWIIDPANSVSEFVETNNTAYKSYPNLTVVNPVACYTLTRTHTGSGGDPVATPSNSTGCPVGQYTAGQVVNLTASPASGYRVASWTGTSNNASTLTTNSVTMPASAHTVGVNYVPVGGKGFGINVEDTNGSSAGGNVAALTWTGGTAQDQYVAIRFDAIGGGLQFLGPLPATATSYNDTIPADSVLPCYALAPLRSGSTLGLSDILCGVSSSFYSGTAPDNFTLRLNQSNTASLSWIAPPGVAGYAIYAIRLDGSTPQTTFLTPTTTSYQHNTGGLLTCYWLVAFNSSYTMTGATSLLCGVPGESTIDAAAAGSLEAAADQARDRAKQLFPAR